MARPRTLILDENVSWRRALCRSLEHDSQIEVLGASGVGEVGLEKVRQLHPEVVVLSSSSLGADPGLLRMLEDLKTLAPRMPVVVSSTLSERGSPQALEYLSRGASAFVSLAASLGTENELSVASNAIRQAVLNRTTSAPAPVSASTTNSAASIAVDPSPSSVGPKRFEAVAIGVSTGGPDVLAKILPSLPASFPAPVFVVQHILPEFTRALTDRLQKACANEVREAVDGEVPLPGTIWIAPGECHLEVVRVGNQVRMRLSNGPPENLCRPAADVLFRSAAKAYGRGLLAVVLTGMGSDGMRGCREIREQGGTVLVQDQASSVVWGMPGAVVEAGLANEILTPSQITVELSRRIGRPAY